MELFALHCTTCRARLKVRDRAALGQILACPKCQSMVQILPPPDWVDPGEPAASTPDIAATAALASANAESVPALAPPQLITSGSTIGKAATVKTPGPATLAAAMKVAGAVPPPLPIAAPSASKLAPAIPRPPVVAAAPTPLTATLSDEQGSSRIVWFGGAAIVAAVVVAAVLIVNRRSENLIAAQPVVHESGLANSNTDESVGPSDIPDVAPPPEVASPQAQTALKPVDAAGEPAVPETKQPNADPADVAKPAIADVAPVGLPAKDPAGAPAPGIVPLGGANAWPAVVDLPPRPKPRGKVEFDLAPVEPFDMRARLALRVPAIEFSATRLTSFLDTISVLSGIPITIDAPAFYEVGLTPGRPISGKFDNITVGQLLDDVLEKQGLASEITEHSVVVTRQRTMPYAVNYSVGDICGETAADQAAWTNMVRQFIAPETWDQFGVTLTIDKGSAKLTNSQAVHQQFVLFCEKLRVARGKPLRSRIDPERFKLTSRTTQASAMLAKPITAHFSTPRPFSEVIDYLQQASGAAIWLDWSSLAPKGLLPQTTLTLDVENQPLGEVLELIVGAAGMQHRVIEQGSLQLLGSEKAALASELEIYPLGDLLRPGMSAETLLPVVVQQLESLRGDGVAAVVHFDAASRCVLVAQPQAAHADFERALIQWRRMAQPSLTRR